MLRFRAIPPSLNLLLDGATKIWLFDISLDTDRSHSLNMYSEKPRCFLALTFACTVVALPLSSNDELADMEEDAGSLTEQGS